MTTIRRKSKNSSELHLIDLKVFRVYILDDSYNCSPELSKHVVAHMHIDVNASWNKFLEEYRTHMHMFFALHINRPGVTRVVRSS